MHPGEYVQRRKAIIRVSLGMLRLGEILGRKQRVAWRREKGICVLWRMESNY